MNIDHHYQTYLVYLDDREPTWPWAAEWVARDWPASQRRKCHSRQFSEKAPLSFCLVFHCPSFEWFGYVRVTVTGPSFNVTFDQYPYAINIHVTSLFTHERIQTAFRMTPKICRYCPPGCGFFHGFDFVLYYHHAHGWSSGRHQTFPWKTEEAVRMQSRLQSFDQAILRRAGLW